MAIHGLSLTSSECRIRALIELPPRQKAALDGCKRPFSHGQSVPPRTCVWRSAMSRRRIYGLSVVSALLLSGIASAQTLKFTPISLHFSSVYLNASSVKTVVVKNNNTSAVTVSSIAASLADYGVTHNCP